jgi:hypothetical protein
MNSLDIKCARCGDRLIVPGMVIHDAPLPHSDLVKQYHICTACVPAVKEVALTSYPIPPYKGMPS